ncbi:MAG TPA: polysaccharide deacetylase family protein [Candidatus Dormibacteraeota bacterium]|nr:polysaccharide deacetylase family protein [Candidatus Dormibacteraeota bacterium]
MATACFTFDNMGEAAEVGAGRLDGPLAAGEEPSLAIGYPALFELLARHGVRATFFVEGWNGVHHPAAVRAVVEHGHELGMHGWAHEHWEHLRRDEEQALATRATEALERAAGVRPRGFRAPGGRRTAHTEEILRALGYAYDASLGDGMTPSRLPAGLAQVPFVWPGVDGFHYLGSAPADPSAVREAWVAALRKAVARDGLFVTVCHAFVTGLEPARLAALAAVIEAAQAAGVAIRTVGEVAARLPD